MIWLRLHVVPVVVALLRGTSVTVRLGSAPITDFIQCSVPCRWSKEHGLVETLTVLVPGGHTYKITKSAEGPQYYPELRMQKGKYYSTTSFKSQVPLTYLLSETQLRTPATSSNAILGASFIARNCASRNLREHWVRVLRTHIRVDGLSSCLNNAPWPSVASHSHWYNSKVQAMRLYKFHLAFENQNEPDYITEKLWLALESGTLPVYLGAQNIREHVPHNSVIVAADFENPHALGMYLKRVNADNTLYNSYHAWRKQKLPQWWKDKYMRFKVSPQCRTCEWAAQANWHVSL